MDRASDQLSTLDFLRAVAAVDVVVCHLLGTFQRGGVMVARLGRVAVLLFFVHTCYVLMLSLERQRAREPRGLFRRFLVRRCLRIYPLPLAVLALILFFQIPSRMLNDGSFRFVFLPARDVASNLALAMNLTHSPMLLGPLWSLPFEMQMYLFLPALFLFAARWRSAWPSVILWVIAVAAITPLGGLHDQGRLGLAYYLPCFLPGVIAYKLAQKVRPRFPFFAWGLALAAVGALCAVLPTDREWIFAWLACFVVGVTVPWMQETRSRPIARVSHWIAQYSYGSYLTHYFCIWLAFRANHFSQPAQWLLFLAMAVAMPVLAYHCVEHPFVVLGRGLTLRSSERPLVQTASAGA